MLVARMMKDYCQVENKNMELEILQSNIRVWLHSAHVLCVFVLPGPPFLVGEAGLVLSNGRSGFRPRWIVRAIFFKQKKTGVISQF